MSRDRRGFQSVDVSGDSHWATKLSKFKVDLDGIDTSSLCRPSCGALIDSGTSLLTFPRSASHITEALKRKVKSDCSNLDELPTLFFELDGAEVVLPPRAYIFKVTENGSPACRGAFMKVDKESQFGEVFILGMPFLRYYFTVFDRANKQVHIARSTEDCKAQLVHGLAVPSKILLVRLESHHSNPSLLPCIVWKFSWSPFWNCLKYTENIIYIYGPVLRLSTPPHGLGPQVAAPIPFYLQAIGSISEVQLRIC
ncbi:unnamed protein product [Cladocopium goreaui]|uniref:Peptidase A1 domain-containing protein n=1 Tax=Cladocopium goreaui TaxID=2562237 RepID=A0A9P1GJU9_9DINO|nr:unnamed protein product [Cladocopium goreaui]